MVDVGDVLIRVYLMPVVVALSTIIVAERSQYWGSVAIRSAQIAVDLHYPTNLNSS